MKIGFIGLGIMGKPMAINLVKAGFELNILDKDTEKMNDLVGVGARRVDTPKAMAEVSDVVISIVPDTPHVEEIVFGDNGIAKGIREGLIYIDMSTIAAEMERKIYITFKQNGAYVLDAPVSGGEIAAINGALSIMVGGDADVFENVLPIFKVLGKKVSYMGEIGAGQITKSCNQIATALATQGVIEALTLAKKAGVDVEKVRSAMLGGFAQSRALELAGQRMIDRNFDPGFSLKLYRKDIRLAQASAVILNTALPGTSVVASEMDDMINQGKGGFDFSALIQHIEELSGL